MVTEYRSPDWSDYVMDWRGDPHPTMETEAEEILAVQAALEALVGAEIMHGTAYDRLKFDLYRAVVRERFEIPWTGISPRVQRLLYAINAIERPRIMVAMGIFCGNTFICNAGSAIGPGAVYRADRLVGIEIRRDEAERARRNVRTIDERNEAEIIAGDGVEWLRAFDGTIDLLYIDADGSYLRIIEAAEAGRLNPGSLILAHNSVNLAGELAGYLAYVRDPKHSESSMNIVIDDQGLEVTRWRGNTDASG
jgi:predicted O-methyltransferase YrrM